MEENSRSTCLASSLVGARTMHWGLRPRAPLPSLDAKIFSMTGRAKARVFPEPVLARARMSEPAMAGSKTTFWMGKSAWMPRASKAPTVTSESPQLVIRSDSSMTASDSLSLSSVKRLAKVRGSSSSESSSTSSNSSSSNGRFSSTSWSSSSAAARRSRSATVDEVSTSVLKA